MTGTESDRGGTGAALQQGPRMSEGGAVARVAERLSSPAPATWLDAAAEALGTTRVSSERHRVHHRPGRSLTRMDRALLDRGHGPEPALLVTHVHADGLPPDAARFDADGTPVAAWTYPHDPYLPGLPRAEDPTWVAQHWKPAGAVTRREVITRRRAYRPTRGAVVEANDPLAGGTAHAFLKVLRPRRLREVRRTHERLQAHLPVPQVLADTPNVLVLEALPGQPLRRALRRGGPLPGAERLVELSVALASTSLPKMSPTARRTEPARLARRLQDVPGDLRPTVQDVSAAVRDLDHHLDERSPVTVHGDLHGGQLLVRDGRVTGLLDLDGVGPGHVVHDAATLIAYLQAQGSGSATARADRYASRVAAAYAEIVDAAELDGATAGAWLALATVAARAHDEARLRSCLDRAAQLIRR